MPLRHGLDRDVHFSREKTMDYESLSEEDRRRLAQAFELIAQGLHVAQDGHIESGVGVIEAGLIMLKPTQGMRPPPWWGNTESGERK